MWRLSYFVRCCIPSPQEVPHKSVFIFPCLGRCEAVYTPRGSAAVSVFTLDAWRHSSAAASPTRLHITPPATSHLALKDVCTCALNTFEKAENHTQDASVYH